MSRLLDQIKNAAATRVERMRRDDDAESGAALHPATDTAHSSLLVRALQRQQPDDATRHSSQSATEVADTTAEISPQPPDAAAGRFADQYALATAQKRLDMESAATAPATPVRSAYPGWLVMTGIAAVALTAGFGIGRGSLTQQSAIPVVLPPAAMTTHAADTLQLRMDREFKLPGTQTARP